MNPPHNARLKAIVFDCDGVMFDSREANRAYYNHLLAAFDLPPMVEEELDYVHTANVTDSTRHIFRRHQIDPAAVDRCRLQLDYTPFLKHMRMEPDLIPFLETIRPHCRTAISTNRTTTMNLLLDTFALRRWFDFVVTAQDTPRPKPAPDALFMIMEHLSLEPEDLLFIGDSQVDREHTRGAGIRLIAFRNPALDAEYHVRNFLEITALPPVRAMLETGGNSGQA